VSRVDAIQLVNLRESVVRNLERKMDLEGDHGTEENLDIHEEVESILEELFQDVQDKVAYRSGIICFVLIHCIYRIPSSVGLLPRE
jgi:hypothetical protein